MSRRLALPIILIILIIVPLSASAQTATTSFDLHAAIASAAPGTVLNVPPGIYVGPFVVDKPLHLHGETGVDGDRAVLDGGGQGTVLTITADETLVENFVVRNSGNVIDQEDGGIVVDGADDVQIVGNRIEEVLYGVRSISANRLTVRGNVIRGRVQDTARRGDGLRFWQSEDGLVEGNTIEQVRDTIFWFSDGSTVRDNVFRHNRYGIHMMYSDGLTLVDNLLADNSVGAYLMYSINVHIEGNTFQNNRGPSGYGVAMKDMDEVAVRDNYFVDNRVGLFFDNSPARIDGQQFIERNVLAYNDAGVLMMPAVQRNVLRQNSFVDNLDQVNVKGGGSQVGDQLGGNRWDGNFWSDYAGYDAAGMDSTAADGVGDLPYRAESLFENLADRHPNLKLFHFSPVEEAIDLAAKAFPVIKPKPKLTDAAPRMTPSLPITAARATSVPSNLGYAALALIVGGVIVFISQIRQEIRDWAIEGLGDWGERADTIPVPNPQSPVPNPQSPHPAEDTMLSVKNLTKRYPLPGRAWWSDATMTALDDVSFRLERGSALALWGANGAGKTTLLKCLLGLLDCEGTLHLDGHDLRQSGRAARRFLGYVPQELAFHNGMRVDECCRFYAKLKRAPSSRIPVVLAQVGLADQQRKAVGALSGGMKQRLALALALLADPPVLLLDEPTSNLDAKTRDEFIDLLIELRRSGKTLLFTSHHAEEVDRLADQVLVLVDGRVAEVRTVDEGRGIGILRGRVDLDKPHLRMLTPHFRKECEALTSH